MVFDRSKIRDKILDLLIQYQRDGRSSPTLRELMHKTGIKSPNTIRYHIKKLKNLGLIKNERYQSRSIKLIKSVGIPIIGKIAAGKPKDNFDQTYEEIPFSPLAFSGKTENIYALKVSGDSMSGAAIMDGDYAIIKKQSHVENGEIAAVMIDGEGTLKRINKKDSVLELISENPEFPPMIFDGRHEIKIFGKMVGLIRRFSH